MHKGIGKLKRVLKETCEECGTRLELRIIQEEFVNSGEEFSVPVENKYCPVCQEFTDVEKEKRHWKKRRMVSLEV